jgi:hypothetical protein
MSDTSKTTVAKTAQLQAESKAEPKVEPKVEIDELEKIMSEIEDLQNDLDQNETPVATSSELESTGNDLNSDDILKEIQANGLVDESNMEETLAELKSEMTSTSLLDEPADEAIEETTENSMSSNTGSGNSGSNPNSSGGSDGSLTMTLTGNMTLKLKYEFEGQEVTISFADQALRVQMTDGTEFKVPVSRIAQASNVRPFKKTG